MDENDDHNYSILENPEEFKNKQILIITKDRDQINQVQEDDKWEEIIMKIDSGAIDTCIPTDVGKRFKLQESQMSRANTNYRAANDTKIKKHGEDH